ncbi:hypothetical protein ES703_89518 [subsurface metagenome]
MMNMVRKNKRKTTYTPYRRWYYWNIRRPKKILEGKSGRAMFQCVFCGMMVSENRLKRDFNSRLYYAYGSRFEKPEFTKEDIEKLKSYYKFMVFRAIQYLKIAIAREYITKEEIAKAFNLFTEQIEKVIAPITTPIRTPQYTPPRTFQRTPTKAPIFFPIKAMVKSPVKARIKSPIREF